MEFAPYVPALGAKFGSHLADDSDGHPSAGRLVKTLLICHHDAALDHIGIARWLGSFLELVGVVQVREPQQRLWRRIRREGGPGGAPRVVDVLAYRAE